MTQEPFTSAGVQQKITDLYALPDNQLNDEAALVRADFPTWLKDNFILSNAQETYLDNMDAPFIESAACDTATAMEFRLPITLTETGSTSMTTARASKLIKKRKNITMEYSETGGVSATGSLDFEIIYAS